uniref:Diadenylate cyclase n=1 Tax=uncultured Armatimonadetes bacterium TaxID=157466 RepID=A0A6J4J9D4_9BACT|nr:Diadenylate cyclase spyDAC; Bacterial checkpoint controller DisA with nucleotide-binding domain [uncultured Armatimonadetes bacterium]
MLSQVIRVLQNLDYGLILRAAIDISVVAYVIYRLILLAKGTRAWQILIGLLVFFVVLFFSEWAGLVTLNYVLQQVTPLGPVAIVILLYPELRHLLEELGRLGFWGAPLQVVNRENMTETLEEIVRTASLLSPRKTGALIVIERETALGDVAANGTELDAEVSTELLSTLFHYGTPLHDGAVIVRGSRIVAAGCTLPLSDAPNISANVHTRHRAAMGISEQSDAAVVVVSEETGTISLAIGGKLYRGLNTDKLRTRLLEAFGRGKRSAPGGLRAISFGRRRPGTKRGDANAAAAAGNVAPPPNPPAAEPGSAGGAA